MATSPERIRELLAHHPVIDGHNDLPWQARAEAAYDFDRYDLATDLSARGHTDIARLRRGGVGAQFWSVFVPSNLPEGKAVTATLEQIDAVHQMVARYSDDFGIARTADEVEQVIASGRIASLLGAEGGQSIDSSLAALRMLYVLGVRYMTLTHNDNNPWADSATDEPVHHGLSPFGHDVVREMNRIGMLVDLSHVSADTMRAALATSKAPVIFSHSSSYAVCSSPRNAPDDVLATLRANHGVIMATFVPDFVSQACADYRAEAREEAMAQGVDPKDHIAFTAFTTARQDDHPKPVATLSDVVAHFEHLREVVGIDHLGVGGDYDGVDRLPEGLADVSCYPALFAQLADLGWSDDDLAKVSGGNILRVLREAEAVAHDLQQSTPPSLVRIDDAG
ncbi:dipeptidase [Calidifontibacter terrae]